MSVDPEIDARRSRRWSPFPALRAAIVALPLLVVSTEAFAADDHDGERRPAPPVESKPGADLRPPPFKSVRYLEDYSYLARAHDTDLLDSIKYVPLWPGGYLSFGGQHRLRSEVTSLTNLGAVAEAARESVLLSRNLLHADLHVSPRLRVFAQLGAYFAFGADGRDAPPDVDHLDVAQLFVEGRASLGGVELVARAGRQEMPLGSTRWFSVRDGTDVRQTFDVVRATLSSSRWTSETFFGTVPALNVGVLDDTPAPDRQIWGSYWTIALLPAKALSVDVFYLGRHRTEVKYRELHGDEVRHTLGLRAFGQTSSGLEYIAHTLLQLGTLGEASILAWGVAGALWQRLPGVLHPVRLGLRGDALSGDSRAGDGRLTTFHPLFPNQTFFSALPAIYPSNLYDVHPMVQMESRGAALEAGCAFFWRQAVADAVYEPPGPPVVPGSASRAPFTGAQLSVGLGFEESRHLSFRTEYSHLFAGPAVTEAGGRDVDFLGTWTTFTY